MNKKSIVILGDSTSMSVGFEEKTYPFLLSRMPVWDKNIQIVNCSIPGFTSADACAFFFKNQKQFEEISSVIIYLGNCDTMSSELYKGKYTILSQLNEKLKRIIHKPYSREKLKNRLLHYKWNPYLDDSIEKSIHVPVFEYNLTRVISFCKKNAIKVVLVNPVAHRHFPSGSGKGNFSFYHYFDADDNISSEVEIDDQRFPNAMRLYDNKEYIAAAKEYKEMLSNPSVLSDNLEFQTLLVNNYAVSKAKAGDFKEAEKLLKLMLDERGCRKEIILYNLALLYKNKGDNKLYQYWLNESYECDKSMYRIRKPYKDIINNVSKRYNNVTLLPLVNIIDDNDFVDHCHALPPAQKKLAEYLVNIVCDSNTNGNSSIEIKNILYNPEYGLGNEESFHQYFKTFSSLSKKEILMFFGKIEETLNSAKNTGSSTILPEGLPADIQYAVEYYQRHPCFSRLSDIIIAKPHSKLDVGRFPEYFIARFIIPYLVVLESKLDLYALFNKDVGLLHSSSDMLKILPDEAKNLVELDIPDIDENYAVEWVDAIINSSKKMLIQHLNKKNQVGKRLKSTIYWYFRETLRFGSHSRISMRYERVLLEYITEALAVALVMDNKSGASRIAEISELISQAERAAVTHEEYCSKYLPDRDNSDLLNNYDNELEHLTKSFDITHNKDYATL